MNHIQTIEINGVKMQVDLRTAVRIEELKVGSRVKVLTKDYGGHKVNHGVIIGFEPFRELPTIIIAYMSIEYSGTEVKFLYYNSASKDVDVVASVDNDEIALDKEVILQRLDSEIAKKEREAQDLRERRQYFLDKFATYWAAVDRADAIA